MRDLLILTETLQHNRRRQWLPARVIERRSSPRNPR